MGCDNCHSHWTTRSKSRANGLYAEGLLGALECLRVCDVLTFAEHQGKTTVTLTGIPINASEAEREIFKAGHKSMQQGFGGTLDQLEQYLAEVRK